MKGNGFRCLHFPSHRCLKSLRGSWSAHSHLWASTAPPAWATVSSRLSNAHCQVYLDALQRHGRDVSEGRIYASQWTIIADDPERVWAQVSENVLYQMNKYIEWGSFEGPDQPAQYANSQQVLDAGAYRLMDASMAVDELVTLATDYPQIRDFHYWAQFPGESLESGSERIQYMADHVIPAVTERLASHAQPAAAAAGRDASDGRHRDL